MKGELLFPGEKKVTQVTNWEISPCYPPAAVPDKRVIGVFHYEGGKVYHSKAWPSTKLNKMEQRRLFYKGGRWQNIGDDVFVRYHAKYGRGRKHQVWIEVVCNGICWLLKIKPRQMFFVIKFTMIKLFSGETIGAVYPSNRE